MLSKMSPVKPSCLLSLVNEEAGCSGIIIHGPSGFILSHATLLLPFLNQNQQLWNKLRDSRIVHGQEFKGAKVRVTFEHTVSKKKSAKFVTTILNTVTPASAASTSSEARVLYVWKNNKFQQSLQSLFPTEENWSFSENANTKGKNDNESEQIAKLMPFFVLLQVKGQIPCELPRYLPSTKLDIGDVVHAVGTPFGTLSPPVFLNSVSKGIICNKSGKEDCLLLTDARCIPGCEGGGLYTDNATDGCLVGIVVAPLCWKANEWVGYTIVCSIQPILDSLESLTKMERKIALSKSSIKQPMSMESIDNSRIVLVQAPLVWGTGLLVDAERGLMITCGHVMKKSKHVDVQVSFPSGDRWFQAEILKAVPDQKAFDIAVLKLLKWETGGYSFKEFTVTELPTEGRDVSMVGYGVFGREHHLQPTVTRGVIAKTVCLDGKMAMIQATCAVHAGASGGPLVAEDGSFVGIVTCNSKDTNSGAMYPHVNLSVPLVTIWPVVQRYIHTNDLSVLDELYVGQPDVQKLWTLQLKEMQDDRFLPSKL